MMLELPEKLAERFEFTVRSSLGIGEIVVAHDEPKNIDGKWCIVLWVGRPGDQFRLTNGDENEIRPAG